MDEGALVTRAQGGDREAYGQLAEAARPAVYAVAWRMTHDKETAMDVTQEALLRGWRSLKKFKGGSKLSTWLVRIAVNVVLNMQRSKRRKPLALAGEAIGSLADPSERRPEDAASAGELRVAFARALDELPESLRAAVVLREVEGASYKEIATALDIPIGTVMSRLHNARKRLREALADFMPGHGEG